jgi:hypothetical protein
MDILLFSILTNFLYFCCGKLIVLEKGNDFYSQFNIYFIGFIIISFIALLLNFFIPLTPFINSIIYSLIIWLFAIKTKFTFNKKDINFLLISSFLTFLLIIYSTVNRPDAGLYHLPYISIINDSKIIFGLSNIHFRFGHISILQYTSAINNNYLFLNNGISIPLASIITFFYLYFFSDIWQIFKKKSISLSNFFSLFIIIYIAFKISRYSEFGNDAVAHFSLFYLMHYLLKNNVKKLNLQKILLISVFSFINKPTLGLVFIAPTVIFILQNNLKIKKICFILFSFPTFFLYLWLIKNIIISGCAIYPVKITCIKSLPWTDIQKIITVSNESEAWSKAWPDRTNKNITIEEFKKNFNWLDAWTKKHLKYILRILIPYVTILLIIIMFTKIKFKDISTKSNKDLNARFFLCLIICIVGVFSFFFIFPLYRYGYSYIVTLISLICIYLIRKKLPLTKNITIYKFILVSCIAVIIAKQVIKIFNIHKHPFWPNVYTLNTNGTINEKKKIKVGDNFFYYLTDKDDLLCMYSKPPCTSYITENIKYIKRNTYSFIELK